ncbi:hypothetical protein K458DRAFT_387956 [Lentithecium fluviatile CBS 122367]|uniref:F-box domain-containing protein n=1 Tax=Lentithecium fluviatile CBS 122367 TaxID=1168545 RepID=A0A6G1J4C9_9PLEO|nr:hypothetical protein K458DRAFT_387956 [Lentithecium fluviatile CBS 122367]
MATFLSLPSEILILICQHLTLPSLLTVRLVHRHLASLVLGNSTSIAPSVVRTTFPEAQLLLRTPPSERQSFDWMKFSHLQQRGYSVPSFGIPAESEIGDALRTRVENGLRVFKTLWEISDNVYSEPDANFDDQSPFHYRESVILERRMEYLQTIYPTRVGADYRIAISFLLASFLTKHDAPPSRGYGHHVYVHNGPDDFDWDSKKYIDLNRGTLWVDWAILHLGPYIFF